MARPKKTTDNLAISLYDVNAKVKKSISLPKEIFSVESSPRLIAQYMRVYLTNQRQGTSSTKTRSEVAGSTKKIYRQKGTGRARHGARKAPIFVGGGVSFGPQPRDLSLKMNKKQKRKALFASLTLKVKDGVISGFTDDILTIEPKTKNIFNVLKQMGVNNKKVLLILPSLKNNLHLAARNINNVQMISAKTINPYAVMNSESIIFTEGAINSLIKHFIKNNES